MSSLWAFWKSYSIHSKIISLGKKSNSFNKIENNYLGNAATPQRKNGGGGRGSKSKNEMISIKNEDIVASNGHQMRFEFSQLLLITGVN